MATALTPTQAPIPTPSERCRYPGARSFDDSPLDQQVFCGRRGDVERLYERVLGARLLVLFSKSGLGKTSLLNAGLFPRLRQKAYLPVPIRLNGKEPLSATVIAALTAAASRPGISLTAGDTAGLWEYLQSTLIWRDGLLLTPVLVFDQFEEVFTLRDAAFRRELSAELGALAAGRPPARLQGTAPLGGPAPEVKLLLSLREEYLGTLQELSAAIPGLFQERVRLAPLNDDDARQAILQPAARVADAGDTPFKTAPFDYDADALEEMLAFLRGDSNIIEPFQLQLLCSRAEETIAARGTGREPARITSADLGGRAGMDAVLSRFYERAVQAMPPRLRGRARRLCEEGLISAAGRRLMLDQTQINAEFGLDTTDLKLLVDKRLLRCEPRLQSLFYEISHDRLAESINRKRRFRIPKKWRQPLIAVACVAVLAVGGLFYVNVRVRAERDQATEARDQANRARADAENLVSFLIGDSFLEKLRPVGRNEILEDVQTRVQAYVERSAAGGTAPAPRTLALALRNEADILRSRGRLANAITLYRRSASAFAAVPDGQADQARALEVLGDGLLDQGQPAEALETERLALALRDALAARHPGQPDAVIDLSLSHSAVGRMLIHLGRPREALTKHLDPALALLQPLRTAAAAAPQLLKALHEVLDNRAEALDLVSDQAGALAMKQQALEVTQAWLRSQPLAADARQRQLTATARMANDKMNQGAVDDARAQYLSIHQAVDELVRWDPSNVRWKRDLEATRLLMAEGWQAAGDYPKALAAYGQALPALTALSEIDRSDLSLQQDLGWFHQSRGSLALKQKQWPLAVEEFSKAERHYAAAIGPTTAHATLQRTRYWVLRWLAEAHAGAGQPAQALAVLHRSRSVVRALMDQAPEMLVVGYDLRESYGFERGLLERQGDTLGAAALAAVRQKAIADALALQPGNADLWNEMHLDDLVSGDVAKAAGKLGAAVQAYRRGLDKVRRATELSPGNAVLWDNLRGAWVKVADAEAQRQNMGAARLAYAAAEAPGLQAHTRADTPASKASYANRVYLIHVALGDLDALGKDPAAAVRNFKRAQPWIDQAMAAMPRLSNYPSNLAILQRRLATQALSLGHAAGWLAAQRAAVDAAERAAKVAAASEGATEQRARLTELHKAYTELADQHVKEDDSASAVDALKAGLAALDRIARLLPRDGTPPRLMQQFDARLADLYDAAGDAAAALMQRRAAADTALRAAALGGEASDFSTAAQRWYELGRFHADGEHWPEALAAFRSAAQQARLAFGKDGKRGEHPMALAFCLRELGVTLVAAGQDAVAGPEFEAAVAAGTQAVALTPADADNWRALVLAQRSLAEHLRRQGRPEQALALYEAALKGAERAAGLPKPYAAAGKDVRELRQLLSERPPAAAPPTR